MSGTGNILVDYASGDYPEIVRYINALQMHGFRVQTDGYLFGMSYDLVFFSSFHKTFIPPKPSRPPSSRVVVILSKGAESGFEDLEVQAYIDAATIGFNATIEELTRLLKPSEQSSDKPSQQANEGTTNGFLTKTRSQSNATGLPNSSRSVFISYARNDRELVTRLIHDMRMNGISVWVDHEGLQPGTPDWEREVRQSIAKSNGMVYVASEDAAASQFVRDELAIARDEDIRVFPFWIRGEKWTRCIPMGWGHTQYADGRGDKFDSAIQSLISSLKKANGGS